MYKTVEQYANEINAVIATMRKTSLTFFETLRKARKELNAEDYDELLKQIDMERSTLLKINKIFECDAVMNNIEKLPPRWGSLYELAKLANDNIDTFIEKINDGTFTAKTTKKEVLRVREDEETASGDVLFITLRLKVNGALDDDVRSEIEAAERHLSQKFEVKSNLEKLLKEAA